MFTVGDADQLDLSAVKYIIEIKTDASEKWLNLTAGSEDTEGKRTEAPTSYVYYYDYDREDRYLTADMAVDTSEWREGKKFLPAAIALAGVLACLTCLITMLKNDAPFSYVVKTLFILVPVRFAMHLAPKALALTRSFIEKGEPAVIRPELMYIMKVICGIGGILLGVYLLLDFDKDLVVPAIVAIIFAVLMIICLERPGIVGVKPGYPVNCVEEAIALVLFPVRVLIALLTLLIGMAAVGGIVYGIVLWFDDGLSAALAFGTTALVPFVVPLIVYFIYLVVVFTLDFYRAIVSIPRKLDELKK